MKKMLFIAVLMGITLGVNAQAENDKEKKPIIVLPQWVKNINFSGYGIVEYKADDKYMNDPLVSGGSVKNHANEFSLRLLRLALDGRIANDFYWKIQMQLNGNTYEGASKGIRLVDLFAEWQKYDFFKVKIGQFKRPFTFENPQHPVSGEQFMSYAQAVSKLAGFGDRTGEPGSNGRDIGLQLQGDFLKVNERNLLHYQVGVFNGEGINTGDKNTQKDIIGGLWVMPVKGVRLGVFGWTGSRQIKYNINNVEESRNVRKNRYALSAEYADNDWTLRAEYVHSQGYGSNLAAGDKADGFYAAVVVPIIKKRFHVKARYDMYRDRKEWSSSKTMYEIGADYILGKYLKFNLEYARVNDRTLNQSNYNLIDTQIDISF